VSIRTNRSLLTALGLGLVLWFASAVAHAGASRAGIAPGVIGLFAPATPAVSLVRGAGFAGGNDVLGAVVFLGALTALVLPALRATRTGAAARVLAVWFAVIVAGWAAGVAAMIADPTGLFAYGFPGASPWLFTVGYLEPVRTGWAWGIAYGWLVGLVAVAVARRDEEPARVGRPAGALGAAIVAGAVAAIGWWAVAATHSAVDSTVDTYVTTARSQFALSVRVAADWLVPVTTSRGAPGAVVLLSGLCVGAIVGGLAWLAVRTTVLMGGRLVLFLGVWAAAIVAATVGAIPTVLATTGLDPEGDGRWIVGEIQVYGPTDGGASGALYGWIPALLVLGVMVWAQRSSAPAEVEPVPAAA
jgi:hypothetical protein